MRKGLTTATVIGVLAAGIYLLLFHNPVGMFMIVFKQNPGHFDRKHLDSVVAQVRLAGLKPGEEREFILENVSDPQSLRPLHSDEMLLRERGAGHVWAEVSSDGKLKVVIETRYLGHAGEYGFAYSDAPLSPKPFGGSGNCFSLDVPGVLNQILPSMKIDEHWWKVENNQD